MREEKESSELQAVAHVQIVRQFEGHLRLRSPAFSLCDGLLQRLIKVAFSVDGVDSVTVNTWSSSALIRHRCSEDSIRRIVTDLTNGSRPRQPRRSRLSSFLLPLRWVRGKVTFVRARENITAWEVVHSIPGRLRIAHPFLRRSPEYCACIEKALLSFPQVEAAKASSTTGTVLVLYDEDLPLDHVLTVLDEELGSAVRKKEKLEAAEEFNPLVVSSSALVLASVSEFCLPCVLPLAFGLTFYAAYPIFKQACHALMVKKKIKADILDAIVVICCLAVGQVTIGAFMVWILDVARGLLDSTVKTSRKLLSDLFGTAPRFATVVSDGKESKVPIDKVQRGDEVVVYTGEQIPVDGTVVSGDAMVDQHILTGESGPVEKTRGDGVFASTLVLAGTIFIQVEESADNASAAKIAKIITESASHQTKVQSSGERMADRMVVPTLALAAGGLASAGASASFAILNADYGTGIRVACPMAMLSCLARAAKHGIVIKKGTVLETLPSVDTFVFDKTGTLTQEMPEVTSVASYEKGVSEETVLWYAATAEQRFSHPIAKAILEAAAKSNLALPESDALKYHVGFGIEVEVNDDLIKVGSIRFMRKEGIDIPNNALNFAAEARRKGGSVILLARNKSALGLVALESSHRPEAYGVIQRLKERADTRVVLLSGDNEEPTRVLATKLGIEEYHAQMLPQDKADYVRTLQKQGQKVAMTGDGINDGIALSKADVSISLQGGSDLAMDVADVIFMDGDLAKFDLLLDISHTFNNKLRRSFLMVVVSNSICIAGALVGLIGLSSSLVFNNGINFISVLYGMSPFFVPAEDEPQPY